MKYLILISLFLFGCSDHSEHEAKSEAVKEHAEHSYYTCSMHPQVHESEPGKCPICHMNLTKVVMQNSDEPAASTMTDTKLYACKDDASITSPSPTICPIDGEQMVEVISTDSNSVVAKVKLSNTQINHFDAKVFSVSTMQMIKDVRLLGSVMQAQEKESNIPLRVDGRVEKVYIKSEGEFVKKGDAVVDIYSPTLISSGEEFVIAKKQVLKQPNSKDYRDLLRQSEERLTNWGISEAQREQWFKDGEVKRTITIYSPTSGIVTARNAVKGKYFKEGQSLFDLVDLSTVWVEMDVYEVDAALVSNNQDVSLRFSALPGTVLKSKLDFVSPVIDPKTRTLKVRATLDNEDGLLKIGMVADGNLQVDLNSRELVVPRSAVVDTGKRKIIWIQTGEKSFEAKTIRTGHSAGSYIQVLEGLTEGDKIVEKGNFLLDAQAQLFGGYLE
ncbi:MAG: efflux transporter periplasmic adaptor subunit [Bdellovibrionales bacterium CG12_big_fil_rev_8_21_14_0_65_38_15]|nr:MAG: efflux transporter periplasmic adaptor subunit [Bdellovibrionales bacterium CG22_combo_CG10-13_8_21_14_all_38_13]PIQ53170.1 MAG: efflux transporter periplasmic adaptor subunit [Bdellovibrionales bacterium CG12_big_fil_rev_8_21_14_0_65_38_15]